MFENDGKNGWEEIPKPQLDIKTEQEFNRAYLNPYPELNPTPAGMIYVVAGTVKQAKDYARKHGIFPRNYTYVSRSQDIKGVSGSVVYVGTWYQRPDLMNVKEEVHNGIQAELLTVIDDE